MQLFLPLKIPGGHCRVINWLNFNIVVSQPIGKPKERKRDGENSWLVEQSEHTR